MTEVDVHAEAIESQSCYPASRSDGRRWRDETFNVRAMAFWGTATSALNASQATETYLPATGGGRDRSRPLAHQTPATSIDPNPSNSNVTLPPASTGTGAVTPPENTSCPALSPSPSAASWLASQATDAAG
jgi:hypothetical protein